MSKTKININQIADLANLSIKKEDVKKLESQLSETLKYIDQLDQVDTSGVEPTSQVTGLENILRKDNPTPSLKQEEALSNSIETQNGFFKVKGILDND